MTKKKLPHGWHWGIGSTTGCSETYWFYTNLKYQYRGQLYTDKNQPWTVLFYEETGDLPCGDTEVAAHPCSAAKFDTEKEALEWLQNKASNLHDPR